MGNSCGMAPFLWQAAFRNAAPLGTENISPNDWSLAEEHVPEQKTEHWQELDSLKQRQ